MSDSFREFFKIIMLVVWSVLLSALTAVLGVVPLRILRIHLGAWLYWFVMAFVVGFLILNHWLALAAFFFSSVLAVGIFTALEERKFDLFTSGFWSVVMASAAMAGAFYLWIRQLGQGWSTFVVDQVESYLNTIPKWTDLVKLEAKDIAQQIPSMVVMVFVFGLLLALLLQNRMAILSGFKHTRVPLKLQQFFVPSFFVWLFLVAFAGSFLKEVPEGLRVVSVNVLNVSIVVFFLQGLAVITCYLSMIKMNWLWKTLILGLLISQMLLFVSVIGVADYWFEFRMRLAKRKLSTDGKIFKK